MHLHSNPVELSDEVESPQDQQISSMWHTDNISVLTHTAGMSRMCYKLPNCCIFLSCIVMSKWSCIHMYIECNLLCNLMSLYNLIIIVFVLW